MGGFLDPTFILGLGPRTVPAADRAVAGTSDLPMWPTSTAQEIAEEIFSVQTQRSGLGVAVQLAI